MKYKEIDKIIKEQLILDGKPLKIGDRVWSYCNQEWVKITGINLKYASESCGSYEQSLIFATGESGSSYGFQKGFTYELKYKAPDLHRIKVDMTFLDKVKKKLLYK